MPRRKCFISYHHADEYEVNRFVRRFDHGYDSFISRGLGQEMTDDIIQSTNPDYVMRRIRERFLSDSTVTIVMLGRCTWARRYVDWEIQASLRSGITVTPNGLLAVKLPGFKEHWQFPERLNANLASPADLNSGMNTRYALHIRYPETSVELSRAIEIVHSRRTTHAKNIVNVREKFTYNRTCV